jgi:hypothetical protein
VVITSHTAHRLATIGLANSTSGSSQSVRTWASAKMNAKKNGVAAAASMSFKGARALTHMATSVASSAASTAHEGVTTASAT